MYKEQTLLKWRVNWVHRTLQGIANQQQYLSNWLHPNDHRNYWLELEQADCNSMKLADLPFITVLRTQWLVENPRNDKLPN